MGTSVYRNRGLNKNTFNKITLLLKLLRRMMTEIYNEKFQDTIKRLSGDEIVITDPPYNIGFKYNQYKDTMPDHDYIEMIEQLSKFRKIAISDYPEEMMRLIVPALGAPDHVGAWCYNSNIPRRFRLINYYGCKPDYSKVKQPYKNPNDKRIKKLIENGSKGTNSYEWWTDIQLVKNVSKEKTEHPCPLPMKLVERIILLITNEGDTIYDPFMGSGTTGEVALKLNRNFVGSEVGEKYFNIASKRLDF